MAKKPTYEELELRVKQLEREALDLKSVEAALRKSEEKYHNIYNRVQVGIFRTRLSDGKVLECNDRFAKNYGFDSREECINNYVVAEHYVDLEARERMLAQLEEFGEINDFEARFYRRDGKIVWIRFSAVAFHDEGFLEGFGYDVTREKAAEEVVRESEKRFRTLIESMAEGIVLKDASNRYLYWNQTASEIFGIGIDELKGETTDSFERQIIREDGSEFHKNDLPSLQTLRTGKPCQNVVMGIRRDPQNTVWIKVNTRPYFEAKDDRPSGVIISFSDITELRRAEEGLSLFKSVLDRSSEACAISDASGRLIYINQAHEKLFGRPLEEARKLNYRDYYPLESVEILEKEVIPLLAKGESWVGELEVFDSAGRKFPLWERADSLHDQSGKLIYGFGFMHDVTDQKRLEEALRQSEEKYRAIYDQSPIAIGIYDPAGLLVDVNRACLSIFGIQNSEDLKGLDLFNDPNIAEEHKESLRKGETVCYEAAFDFEKVKQSHYYDTSRKGFIWLDVLITPLAGESLQGYLFQVQEITNRKLAEKSLKESEDHLSTIMNSLTDMVLEVDPTMKVLWANKRALDLNPHAVGQACYKAFPGNETICEGCVRQRSFETGGIEIRS